MAILTWAEEYSVGVKEIDLQHQRMFSIINRLYDLMTQFKAQDEVDGIIKELVEYADYHFKTEESYFEKFNYEGKVIHVAIHQKYKERVEMLTKKRSEEGGVAVSYEILDFLEDWWMQHINVEDKKYMQCFKNNGLS